MIDAHMLENALAFWSSSLLRASFEGGVVIALVWALCRLWPGMSPSGRSWLWRAAFCKLLLSLCWPGLVGVPLLPSPATRDARATSPLDSGAAIRSNEESVRDFRPNRFEEAPTITQNVQTREQMLPNSEAVSPSAAIQAITPRTHFPTPTPLNRVFTQLALFVWFLGVVFLLMRSVWAWRWTQRLRASSEPLNEPCLRVEVDELRLRFGLARSPELLLCPGIEALALTGVFRPAILLPTGFSSLDSDEVRAPISMMMAHELAHQKRRDLAWNWLLWAGQTLFWFHPLVWLGAREWRLSQEIACDALAVQVTRAPLSSYGAMLLQTALSPQSKRREELFSLGVSARYATLSRRLSAMKHFNPKTDKRALVLCALVASLFLFPWKITARSASAQSASTPQIAAPDKLVRAQNGQAIVSTQVQDASGQPVRGATVVLNADSTGVRLLTRRTDASGRVEFRVAAPPDGSPFKSRATVYAPGFALQSVQFKEGRAVTIRLQRDTKIRGLVRDEAGNPVVGVPVALESVYHATSRSRFASWIGVPSPLRPALMARTDVRGRYELAGVPANFDKAALEILSPRFVHRRFEVPLRLAGRATSFVAPLQTVRAASSIVGRVVDGSGRPLSGIEVIASGNGAAHGEAAWNLAMSAPDGTFRVGSLPPGRFKLMMRDRTDKVVARPVPNIQTRFAGVARAPGLRMTAGGVVEGAVVDFDSGQPVAGAWVGDAGGNTLGTGGFSASQSREQGRFRVRIPAGKGRIYISSVPRGYLWPSRTFPVEVGEGQTVNLSLRIKKGQMLRGVALDEKGRAPKNALVVATKIEPEWMRNGLDEEKLARVNASGKWSLDSLSAGRYTLRVRGDWELATPRDSVEVEVPANNPIQLQVRFAPLPTLGGRVVTPDGQPIPGVRIGLNINWPRGNDTVIGDKETLTTDVQGRFARPRLRPDAQLYLRASKSGFRFVSGGNIARVRTAKGTQFKVSDLVLAPADVNEMLRAGAPITGRVLYSNGQPAKEKLQLIAQGDLADSLRRTVDWRGQNNGRLLARLSADVQTDQNGGFKIAGLAALPYSLFLDDKRTGWILPSEWNRNSLISVPPARGQSVKLPDTVLERGALVNFRVVDRETGEKLSGEMPLRFLSKSRFGSVGGRTSTFAVPPQTGGKTVPEGTFSLQVWRNPDGRIREAAHMWTPTNQYIRYYELTSPTLEVSVNGGARQKVRDGRVSFPVVAGQTYEVTYFLHRLRPGEGER